TSGVNISATGELSLISNNSSPNLINDAASITVASGVGSLIDLELAGNFETVASFLVGTTAQSSGLYGSATYYAESGYIPNSTEIADESYFTGNGALSIGGVVPEPASVGLLLAASMLGICRRRRVAR
ncbi:MAG TPA: PEP-CTERM sorting domain-containing protein, partial [Tepidisphaeraceae bacterium]|nr:PEP-CTERM sorting domain-containing protein [Tepidisphaeraceae bacterium]